MSLAIKLQSATSEFQKLQGDMAKAVEARQKLEAQLSENELVKKEFSNLTPENTVYKQIGHVLVKQDIVEVKINVDTRLEFIKGEMLFPSITLKYYSDSFQVNASKLSSRRLRENRRRKKRR